ncbi:hypothetical protein J1N35_018764 [Gossypium stocksii]|uniref:Uncharacterized protein n=1 Tax=Gossypium stocksii TaxID=47602 RepID=A0A9D4A593_9ROSI|nr:hypothetical protein J1N35_018764 [Gossypium stocksii]
MANRKGFQFQIVMLDFLQSTATSSQNSQGTKRKWILKEDVMLVAYRAIGKDAQTTTAIIEEIDFEDVSTKKNPEKGSTYHGCKDDVSLDEMDVSATQLQPLKPNQDDSTLKKKDF